MDQVRIGSFLKELRKEKALTQEQLSERFGVTGRTVSRWENGNNMPDISILVELADFYDVDIREIIDGERKSEDKDMDKEMKDTLVKVAEYTNEEKARFSKQLITDAICCMVCITVVIVAIFLRDIGKDAAEIEVAFSCVALGTILSVIKNILRLNGSINKDRFNKMNKIAIAAAIPPILLCIMMIIAVVWL